MEASEEEESIARADDFADTEVEPRTPAAEAFERTLRIAVPRRPRRKRASKYIIGERTTSGSLELLTERVCYQKLSDLFGD